MPGTWPWAMRQRNAGVPLSRGGLGTSVGGLVCISRLVPTGPGLHLGTANHLKEQCLINPADRGRELSCVPAQAHSRESILSYCMSLRNHTQLIRLDNRQLYPHRHLISHPPFLDAKHNTEMSCKCVQTSKYP